MHDTISLLRELTAQDFTSGAQIAQRLGISRASVSTGLAKAEDYGVTLVRRHGVGYRLSTPIDWLDSNTIAQYLDAGSVITCTVANTLASTNRTLLQEHEHGKMLVSEWQEQGRGRLGRTWLGALGGSLLFSLAWRFAGGPAQLAGLPLAVGIAVAHALQQSGVNTIGLKWPNDLLLQHGETQQWMKVGGILIEMQGDALGPANVVVGVGLNLTLPNSWQNQLDQAAGSLLESGLNCGRNELLARVLNQIERMLSEFAEHGFAPLCAQWEALHAWRNVELKVILPNGTSQTGQFIGLAPDGALRLQTPDGELIVNSGDVSLRRAA
jgi:BirA family biotin operon repressor/biotin-[acetyl-CoA-carboxylase] ligase